jgi:hypothetical protein
MIKLAKNKSDALPTFNVTLHHDKKTDAFVEGIGLWKCSTFLVKKQDGTV